VLGRERTSIAMSPNTKRSKNMRRHRNPADPAAQEVTINSLAAHARTAHQRAVEAARALGEAVDDFDRYMTAEDYAFTAQDPDADTAAYLAKRAFLRFDQAEKMAYSSYLAVQAAAYVAQAKALIWDPNKDDIDRDSMRDLVVESWDVADRGWASVTGSQPASAGGTSRSAKRRLSR
jgi:hypothetical protein